MITTIAAGRCSGWQQPQGEGGSRMTVAPCAFSSEISAAYVIRVQLEPDDECSCSEK